MKYKNFKIGLLNFMWILLLIFITTALSVEYFGNIFYGAVVSAGFITFLISILPE